MIDMGIISSEIEAKSFLLSGRLEHLLRRVCFFAPDGELELTLRMFNSEVRLLSFYLRYICACA